MPRYSQNSRRTTGRSRTANARRPTYRGSGAYTLDNGPWAKRGAAAGSFIGGKFGGPVGAYLGGALGRRLFHYPAKLFGSGAYYKRQRRPLIRGHGSYEVDKMAPEVPTFSKNGDYVEISHREYICDIISHATPGNTRVETFAISPSETATFPWLASIVQPSFQQYKFEGCVFQFQSRSADALNSTNTALGSVVSGIDYDTTASDFNTRQEIENLQWSQSCKPSCDTNIPVECATRYTALGGGMLYVLNQAGTPTEGVDLKTYILGKLYILTTGMQGSSVNLGSLYVTYKIRLYKPMISRPLSNANVVKYYRTGISNTAPLGVNTLLSTYTCDTLGVTFNSAGTGISFRTDRLQAGMRLQLVLQIVGNSSSGVILNTTAVVCVGVAPTGGYLTSAGGVDGGTIITFPTVASTEVQCGCIIDLEVIEGFEQLGASVNWGSSGHGIPGAAKALLFITQKNGLDTAKIGYYNGY